MSDLNADIEKRTAEIVEEPKKGPNIVEGNTGTLTVVLLDNIVTLLKGIKDKLDETK
jgi:hypothetical protein